MNTLSALFGAGLPPAQLSVAQVVLRGVVVFVAGHDDLLEELRLKGVERLAEVKLARFERSGEVSVIRAGQS